MSKEAEYEKRKDGNYTVFCVTPAKAPKFGFPIGFAFSLS